MFIVNLGASDSFFGIADFVYIFYIAAQQKMTQQMMLTYVSYEVKNRFILL